MRATKINAILVKILTALAILTAILLIIFFVGRYGWKLGGFRACESAAIETVEVSAGQVTLTGYYPGSFPEGFLGYYAEESDGKLYVGFKFSSIFGFFESGDFEITIPTKETVSEVYLKTGENEYRIWSVEGAGK